MDRRRCSTPLFLWREAITDRELGPRSVPGCTRASQIAVAVAGLSLHMTTDGDKCFPSIERICNETGLTRRSVQRALRALAHDGWLRVAVGGGRGRTNCYYLRTPVRVKRRLQAPAEDLLQAAAKVAAELHVCPDCLERFYSEAERNEHYERCEFLQKDEQLLHKDADPNDRSLSSLQKGVTVAPFSGERAPPVHERAPHATVKGATMAPEVLSRSPEVSSASAVVVSLADYRARRGRAPDAGYVADGSDVAAVTASSPPEWVWVWWWSRSRGDTRDFPQMASSASPISDEAYAQLKAEWRLAGAPREMDPRWLVAATSMDVPHEQPRKEKP